MKPTKTQAEITKLEKQIAKLHGDLAQKRRLEALRAEADGLQKALKAEPCDKPHYPAPCPLPHSPWGFQPWAGQHSWDCRCSVCRPYWWTGTAGNPIMTTTPNTGKTITIYGNGYTAGDTVSVFATSANSNLNTGTQMGADGVPFTYTSSAIPVERFEPLDIGRRMKNSALTTTPTHLGVPYNEASPFQIERAPDYDPYANKMES